MMAVTPAAAASSTPSRKGKQASLADLKAGDKVKIDFEKNDDVLAVNATRAS